MDIREKVLSFGTFRFYPSRQQLFDGDQPLRVGSRALGLLQLLIENAGEVVPKNRFIETVWNGLWVDEANLRANIGTLRKVLGDGRDGRRYIQNVTGRGYRFVTPVQGRTHGLSENSPSHDAAPETDRLIGRAQDAESVSEELTANRVVSVVGPEWGSERQAWRWPWPIFGGARTLATLLSSTSPPPTTPSNCGPRRLALSMWILHPGADPNSARGERAGGPRHTRQLRTPSRSVGRFCRRRAEIRERRSGF